MAGVSISPNNDSIGLTKAVVTSSSATVTLITGISGTFIRVYKMFLVSGGTSNWTFNDGTTAISGPMPFVVNGAFVLDMDGTPWFACGAGNNFTVTNSGSTSINGTIYYTQSAFGN